MVEVLARKVHDFQTGFNKQKGEAAEEGLCTRQKLEV